MEPSDHPRPRSAPSAPADPARAPRIAAGADLDALEQAMARELLTARRPSAVRLTLAAFSVLVLLALLGWLLPRAAGADWPRILTALTDAGPAALITVILAGILAVGLGALPLRAVRAGGGADDVPVASLPMLMAIHAASSGIGLLLPGGGMLGVGVAAVLLRRRGASVASLLTVLLAVAAVETMVIAVAVPLLGVLAYALLAATTDAPGLELAVAVAAVSIALTAGAAATVLPRRRFAVLVRGAFNALESMPLPLGRVRADDVLAMRGRMLTALRERWALLALPQLAIVLVHATVWWIAVRALGGEVPLLGILAVFALGRVLAMIPLTPGGAGIAETVAAVLLVQLGMPGPHAASAALLSLVATLLVPAVLTAVTAGPLLLARSGRAPRAGRTPDAPE